MFGYLKTDNPNMYVKDTVLYKSMYCGLCKGLGCSCGVRSKFTLNYDLTFLSVLLHNVMNKDVKIEKKHCIIHPITKRTICKLDDLTKRIANLNVLLSYYKLTDDVIDNNKKKFVRSLIKSSYKKAKKSEPQLCKIIHDNYEKLRVLEKNNCESIDIISDPFAKMFYKIVENLTGEFFSVELGETCYNVGKWIYLIDALDDFNSDIKNNDYNVFTLCYKTVKSKKDLLDKYSSDLEGIFGTIMSNIRENSIKIKYNFNHDLIDNILFNGIYNQTKKIMEKDNER